MFDELSLIFVTVSDVCNHCGMHHFAGDNQGFGQIEIRKQMAGLSEFD